MYDGRAMDVGLQISRQAGYGMVCVTARDNRGASIAGIPARSCLDIMDRVGTLGERKHPAGMMRSGPIGSNGDYS